MPVGGWPGAPILFAHFAKRAGDAGHRTLGENNHPSEAAPVPLRFTSGLALDSRVGFDGDVCFVSSQ